MDRAFQTLVAKVGVSLVDAAPLCATTPAWELGLVGQRRPVRGRGGRPRGARRALLVVQTYVGGQLVYRATVPARAPPALEPAAHLVRLTRRRIRHGSFARAFNCLGTTAAAALLAGRPASTSSAPASRDSSIGRRSRSPTTGTPDIDLSTFDGSIEIRPWDKSEVLVVIEKRGRDKKDTDSIEVQAEQDGNHVSVAARSLRRDRTRLFVVPRLAQGAADRVGAGVVEHRREERRRVDRHRAHHGPRRAPIGRRQHPGERTPRRCASAFRRRLDQARRRERIARCGHRRRQHFRQRGVHQRARANGRRQRHDSRRQRQLAASADWDIVTGDGSVTLELPDGFSGELDAHTGDGGIRLRDVAVSNVDRRNIARTPCAEPSGPAAEPCASVLATGRSRCGDIDRRTRGSCASQNSHEHLPSGPFARRPTPTGIPEFPAYAGARWRLARARDERRGIGDGEADALQIAFPRHAGNRAVYPDATRIASSAFLDDAIASRAHSQSRRTGMTPSRSPGSQRCRHLRAPRR